VYTLPFEYEDKTSYGLRAVTGVLNYDGKTLHIEYQTKDAILGLVKGDVTDLRIPLAKIREMQTKKKWFSKVLIFKVDSLRTLEGLPGVTLNTLEMKIKKDDFNIAQNLASTINLQRSELRLNEMRDDNE
jgi:hypothetical protein